MHKLNEFSFSFFIAIRKEKYEPIDIDIDEVDE